MSKQPKITVKRRDSIPLWVKPMGCLLVFVCSISRGAAECWPVMRKTGFFFRRHAGMCSSRLGKSDWRSLCVEPAKLTLPPTPFPVPAACRELHPLLGSLCLSAPWTLHDTWLIFISCLHQNGQRRSFGRHLVPEALAWTWTSAPYAPGR